MISLSLSLTSLFLLAYYYRYANKRQSLIYWIKAGRYCYSCKDNIETFDINHLLKNDYNKGDHFKICKTCSREGSISQLLGKPKIKSVHKFKMYLMTNHWIKLQKKLMILICILPIFGILIHFVKINLYLSEISGTLNLFIVLLMIYQYKISSTIWDEGIT